MNEVKTYRALDYHIRLWGLWPVDVLVAFVVFILVHGIFNSMVLDSLVVGPVVLFGWKARRRPPLSAALLLSFVSTPQRFIVGLKAEASGR